MRLCRKLIYHLSLLYVFASPAAWASSPVAIALVPGTFNSLAPGSILPSGLQKIWDANPYFSAAILNTLHQLNGETLVIHHLLPFGDFRENGKITALAIRNWYLTNHPKKDIPLVLVGHSVGTFYALSASEALKDLPLTKVISISCPLLGMDLAVRALTDTWLGKFLEGIFEHSSGFFDFRGLPELTPSRVHDFLSTLRIPHAVPLITLAASQAPPPNSAERFEAEYLSPTMKFTASYVSGPSDGVISVSSALGASAELRDDLGGQVPVIPFSTITPLEHAEQIIDYRILKAMGTRNAEYVQAEQIKLYQSVSALAHETDQAPDLTKK